MKPLLFEQFEARKQGWLVVLSWNGNGGVQVRRVFASALCRWDLRQESLAERVLWWFCVAGVGNLWPSDRSGRLRAVASLGHGDYRRSEFLRGLTDLIRKNGIFGIAKGVCP